MAHMRTYQIHRPFASRSRRWTYDRRRVPPQDWTFGRHLPCRKGPDFEGVTNSYCCTCFHPHHPSPPGQLQRFQPPHSALISEGPLAGPSPGRSTRALLPRAPLKVGCPLLCIVNHCDSVPPPDYNWSSFSRFAVDLPVPRHSGHRNHPNTTHLLTPFSARHPSSLLLPSAYTFVHPTRL